MLAPTLVGFDLDMTLIDSRPGIRATYAELRERLGIAIDLDVVTSRLGPPLEVELAHWLPSEHIPEAADLYRALYPDIAIGRIAMMPGAHAALAAVHSRGGRTLVLTAKNATNAQRHVDHLGIDVDEVVGDAWRDGKAAVLRELEAVAYVGDHVHDMEAGRSAAVLSIGVATGPCSVDQLHEAGADHVVTSMTEVPGLLQPVLTAA